MHISCPPRAVTASRFSGTVDPPDGATFAAVLIGEAGRFMAPGKRCRLRIRRALARNLRAQQEG